MKILIISDLHLGDGSKADDFSNNDAELIEWIRNKKADKVYLNGDIYELWQFKSQKIRNAHYLLIKKLNSKKFYHICGNHDYKLMSPMSKTFRTKSGKKVLISHGFQNDPAMTSPFSRIGIWALTWLERFIPNIDNENAYNKNRKKSRVEKKTQTYADKMLERYDMVFCGHTHKAMLAWTEEGKIYGNSGTCIHGKQQGILLNTDTDEVTLV